MRLLDADKTSDNIAFLIKDRKIKISEIAKEMNITRWSVYYWLKHKTLPSLDNLVILSGVLNCSLDDIVVYNED